MPSYSSQRRRASFTVGRGAVFESLLGRGVALAGNGVRMLDWGCRLLLELTDVISLTSRYLKAGARRCLQTSNGVHAAKGLGSDGFPGMLSVLGDSSSALGFA